MKILWSTNGDCGFNNVFVVHKSSGNIDKMITILQFIIFKGLYELKLIAGKLKAFAGPTLTVAQIRNEKKMEAPEETTI